MISRNDIDSYISPNYIYDIFDEDGYYGTRINIMQKNPVRHI